MSAVSIPPHTRVTPRYAGLRVTREEYLDLPDDETLYDMIDGLLHLAPSPDSEHSRSTLRFGHKLMIYLEANQNGQAYVELDVFLPDGGDVLRPDLCFVLSEHASIVKNHIHGTPDLVCEVLSPGTAARDRGVKAERYLKNGVSEYWLIDPVNKTIELWLNRGDAWEKTSGENIASRLLPGLVLNRAEFFA